MNRFIDRRGFLNEARNCNQTEEEYERPTGEDGNKPMILTSLDEAGWIDARSRDCLRALMEPRSSAYAAIEVFFYF